MQNGSHDSHIGLKLSRIAQASMNHGRSGSEIGITLV
jgi:hypothetical protein